ncbi:CIA30 family protein [Acidobacteriota bacterium]
MTKPVNSLIFRLLSIVLIVSSFSIFVSGIESKPEINKEGIVVETESSFLIDDFSNTEGVSSFGTRWRQFTDRVMGGLSTASSGYEVIKGRSCLRLQGLVSLENDGGFVQVALPLDENGRFFDASEYTGVRLWSLGNGEMYHVHIRTSQSRRPWQYYSAEFVADGEWNKVEIPFGRFKPESLDDPLNAQKLARIAIVGIGKEFKADVAVYRLEFYK